MKVKVVILFLFSVSMMGLVSAGDFTPDSSCLRGFHFNESGSNPTALDFCDAGNGNGLDGVSGGAAGVDLNDGLSYDFSSSGSEVEVSDSNDIDFAVDDSFSISFWMKSSGFDSSESVIDKRNADGESFEGYGILETFNGGTTGEILMAIRDQSGDDFLVRSDTGDVGDGEWRHFVFTYDGSNSPSGVTIYINGSDVAQAVNRDSSPLGTISSSANLHIGDRSDDNGDFNGFVDEPRVFNKELTTTEVSNLFSSNQLNPNSPPSIDSFSITPDPPQIGNPVDASYDVSDSDGTVEWVLVEAFHENGTEINEVNTTYSTSLVNDTVTDLFTPSTQQNYTVYFTATDNSGAQTVESIEREAQPVPDNAPSVTLQEPADGASFGQGAVSFNATATDDYDLVNATLYTNESGTWTAYNSTTFAGTETWSDAVFSRGYSGTRNIEWNMKFYDNASQQSTASSNFTFKIENQPPTIDNYTSSPLSGNWVKGDTPDLIYEVSDPVDVVSSVNLTAYLDGQENATATNFYSSGSVSDTVTDFFTIVVGDYSILLEASDDTGRTSKQWLNESVADTYPPVSTLNNSQTTYFKDTVPLKITATDADSSVDRLSYRTSSGAWTTVNDDNASFTLSGFGDYQVEFNATDTEGNVEATNQEIISLEGLEAGFFWNPNTPGQDETVTFNAGTSTGNITLYEWDFQSDGTYDATGETTTHSFGSTGLKDVTLRVTNSDGDTDTVTNTIEVVYESANKSLIKTCPDTPFCRTGGSPTTDNPVSIDGSLTALDGNQTYTYTVNATGQGGEYDFFAFYNSTSQRLNTTVFSNIYTVGIATNDTNFAPNADFDVSFSGLTVDVDASPSSDPNNAITSYEWDWTSDGNYDATGLTSSHTYGSDGTYDITLRVSDGNLTDTVTKTVQVSEDTDGGDGGGDGGVPGDGDQGTPNTTVAGDTVTLLAPHRGARYGIEVFSLNEGETQTITTGGEEQTFRVVDVESQSTAQVRINGVDRDVRERDSFEVEQGTGAPYNVLVNAYVSDIVEYNDSAGEVWFSVEGSPVSTTTVPAIYRYSVNDSATFTLQYRRTGFRYDWKNVSQETYSQDINNSFNLYNLHVPDGIYEARVILESNGDKSTTRTTGWYVGDVPYINITDPEDNEVFTRTPNGESGYTLPLDFRMYTLNDTELGAYYSSGGTAYTEFVSFQVSSDSEEKSLLEQVVNYVLSTFGFDPFQDLNGEADMVVPEYGDYTGYVNATYNGSGAFTTEWNATSIGVPVTLERTDIENVTGSEVIDVFGLDEAPENSPHVNKSFNESVDLDGDGVSDGFLSNPYFFPVEPAQGSTVEVIDLEDYSQRFSFYLGYEGSVSANKSLYIEDPDNFTAEISLNPSRTTYQFDVAESWLPNNTWKEGDYIWYGEIRSGDTTYTTLGKENGVGKFDVEETLPEEPIALIRFLVTESKEALADASNTSVFAVGFVATLFFVLLPMIPLWYFDHDKLALVVGAFMYVLCIVFYVTPAFIAVATGIAVLAFIVRYIAGAIGGGNNG